MRENKEPNEGVNNFGDSGNTNLNTSPTACAIQISTTTPVPGDNKMGQTTTRADIPTFQSISETAIQHYQQLLADAPSLGADAMLGKAITQVASMLIGAHAFDAVKAFFDRRKHYPKVQLIVAEDNEAVIGCEWTEKTWHLKCNGNQWIGVVGNCSAPSE